ncbi:unnamed protein product [Mytilus coruscus]|uniref:Uncharacterized protein n=1 Tax=Mytilus coruscus TaxID=42192 RepID=A0A6J8DVY5_MYTCO|nr:unnamed protein product [Mytilus coruscus]
MGDPIQVIPTPRSSIKTKPHWPGEASAWDKNVSTKRGAPSYPMGHISNYAGQGSAPCTQPAHTGGGQYETPRSRYGKWQDNRGADTRQAPAQMYGKRQDNRGDDTRQTPARAYGDGQPRIRTTGKGYYGPEGSSSTWKSELENTNKFENKLGQVHEKLDDMMDQFRKLLTRPTARSPSPGGRPATGRMFPLWGRGHFKQDCPKFRERSQSKAHPLSRVWAGKCMLSLLQARTSRNECPDRRSKENCHFADHTRTTPNPLNSNRAAPEARASPENRGLACRQMCSLGSKMWGSDLWDIIVQNQYVRGRRSPAPQVLHGVVHLDSGEQIKLGTPIVQSVLTHDQGDPGGVKWGEIPGSLWFERGDLSLTEDTSPAEVTMASYGEPQESWDSTEGHNPPRAVSTIDTALESNEEAHNSGDSSSEEAETTLVDEESDCRNSHCMSAPVWNCI